MPTRGVHSRALRRDGLIYLRQARVKLAESFGAGAARVTSPDQFRPALEKALADGGPYVIAVEVPTDSEVSPWAFIHPAKP